MISVNVKIDCDFEKIRNRLDDGQKFLVNQVSDNIDNYIPIDSGNLRGSKVVGDNEISWNAINPRTPSYGSYAAIQYYTNSNGMKYWDERMWADKGEGIVKSVADFLTGGL